MKGVFKMSVKMDLERLKAKKRKLEEEKALFESHVMKSLESASDLERKKQELTNKKSSLAQTLKAKNEKELNDINRYIESMKSMVQQKEKELQDVQVQIDERENKPTLYIWEQTQRMIPEFLEWLEGHLEEIGYQIIVTFAIRGERFHNIDSAGKYYGYTGEVGIYLKEQNLDNTPIVCSKGFYFKRGLYARTSVKQKYHKRQLHCNCLLWYNFIECIDFLNRQR